jgi:lipopolysaccharide transport system ATP-binding protein
MYVRLAFAVAAHMEAEIILIDEILAVGDIEFQNKCLNKINEIVAKNGRTVVIISHNLDTVRNLCCKCLLLSKGGVNTIGHPEDVIKQYGQMSLSSSGPVGLRRDRKGLGKIKINDLKIENLSGLPEIYSGDKTRITIRYGSDGKENGILRVSLVLYDQNNRPLARFDNAMTGDVMSNNKAEGTIVCETGSLNFAAGDYYFNIAIWENANLQDFLYNAINLKIHKNNNFYNFTGDFDERTDKALIAHSFKIL